MTGDEQGEQQEGAPVPTVKEEATTSGVNGNGACEGKFYSYILFTKYSIHVSVLNPARSRMQTVI